jgi:hypothetical protein
MLIMMLWLVVCSVTMADENDPTYDPMKDPTQKPRRPIDLSWNYGYMVTPGISNIVKCNIVAK